MMTSLLPMWLEAAVRALAAALAVWTGLRLLRVKSYMTQKAAWILVLGAAFAMPLMPWQWLPGWAAIKLPRAVWTGMSHARPPKVSAPAVAASPTVAQESIPLQDAQGADASPAPAAQTGTFQTVSDTRIEGAPVAAATTEPASKQPSTGGIHRSLTWFWVLYLGVCATLLFRLLWGLVSTLRLWFDAIPVTPAALIGLDSSVRSSHHISSPVNIGSGILLPADYREWGEEKLRVVLAHERSHIRQRDFYLQLLAGLYIAVTWFSPLGWWLRHKLTELGEAISDRAGLEAATSRPAYAELLLEFAALPRNPLIGVPMAHQSKLSQRIERLLDEAHFRQAFAGGRRRALVALLLPAALILVTALVRVEASTAAQQVDGSQPAITGQLNPQPAQVGDADATQATPQPATPEAAPAPPVPPDAAGQNPPPVPPTGPEPAAPAMQAMPPVPPVPPVDVQVVIPPIPPMPDMHFMANLFQGPCMGNGDAYALVGDAGTETRFCGDWGDEGIADVEKAHGQAHGHFLLFRHEGKLYIIDDPATVLMIEAMHKQVEDQAEQMRAMGKQMREAGEQAREAARKVRKAYQNVPTPDLSKEVAALNASVADLKAHQGGTVTREQLAEVQREVGELQRSLISAEIKSSFDAINSEVVKSFYAGQGKFGQQMGQLGAEMGRMSVENNKKVGQIIDDSLKNGKARPVN